MTTCELLRPLVGVLTMGIAFMIPVVAAILFKKFDV